MAGLDIKGMRADERLKRGLFLKSLGAESLTHSPQYGHASHYRRKVRDEMARLRADGLVKVNPEVVGLSCAK